MILAVQRVFAVSLGQCNLMVGAIESAKYSDAMRLNILLESLISSNCFSSENTIRYIFPKYEYPMLAKKSVSIR